MKKKSTTDTRYNNQLFKSLINIYDPIAIALTPVRHRIVKELERLKPVHVLDVACGTGTQAILLAQQGYNVTGIDLSSAMLARAKEKAGHVENLTFIHGDATKLPFEDKIFDVTTISFGLHDMPESIRATVLREMKRVTKIGGRIIVADYANPKDQKVISKIERQISNLFESKYYDSFMGTGLKHYLDEVDIKQGKKILLMAGVAQLVVCTRDR